MERSLGLTLAELRRLGMAALFCLGLLLYLGKANDVLLRGIDSNIHATAALQVTSQGFAPRVPIPMLPDAAQESPERLERFNDHPFFSFWVNGGILRALGPNAFAARLTTALASAATVLLTLAIGAHFGSVGYGLVAAFLLAVARDWVFTGATMSLDPLMISFIVLSFWLALKERWWLVGAAAGVGLWIKTPIVLLVYPTLGLALVFRRSLERRWDRQTLRGLIQAFSVSVALGALFWGLTAAFGNAEAVRDYWSRQLWGTAVGGRGAVDHQPWLFLTTLRLGFLPGLPLLLYAIYWVSRRNRFKKPGFLLLASAVACVAIPVTLMRFKMGHYFTPTFPFLALMAALPFDAWANRHERKLWTGVIGLTLGLLTFAVTTPFKFAPESFLALKRFMPFMQTYGSCSDRVTLVPGGEPIGSAQDYTLVLHTYVQKPVDTVGCASLGEHLRSSPRTQWVVLAAADYERCVPVPQRGQFGLKLRAGGQLLLGRGPAPRAEVVDLTPLQRELQMSADCVAPPYAKDIYHSY